MAKMEKEKGAEIANNPLCLLIVCQVEQILLHQGAHVTAPQRLPSSGKRSLHLRTGHLPAKFAGWISLPNNN